jgi:hypothetical protein
VHAEGVVWGLALVVRDVVVDSDDEIAGGGERQGGGDGSQRVSVRVRVRRSHTRTVPSLLLVTARPAAQRHARRRGRARLRGLDLVRKRRFALHVRSTMRQDERVGRRKSWLQKAEYLRRRR